MLAESDIAQARVRWDVIAADVALKRRGRELVGCCPFHHEKTPSFFVAPDKGFFHCFSCGAHGHAIDYVMRARNLDFPEAVADILGLPRQRPKVAAAPVGPAAPAPDDDDHAADVARILAACEPVAQGTAAHLYLWARALIPRSGLPRGLPLFAHRSLYCHEIREHLPALVASIVDRNEVPTAVMRIWLRHSFEGEQKDNRAPLDTRKKSLGRLGDGAVRLGAPGPLLGFAEGIETALAVRRTHRMPVWALCGVTRMGYPAHWRDARTAAGERPRVWIPPDRPPAGVECRRVGERAPSIWVPPGTQQLVFFGDNGFVGKTCATHAANWFTRHGTPAAAKFPAAQFSDFNDEFLAGERQ